MSGADPIDPVPLNRAVRELALAWDKSKRVEADVAEEGSGQTNELIWEMSQAQLKRRFGSFPDAAVHVFRHAIVSQKIRVWVEDGPNWKRPTLHTIMRHLPPASGLYADRDEVNQVFARQWPEAYADMTGHLGELRGGSMKELAPNPARTRGRPKGDGYSRKDVPVFQKILQAQRESGDVETKHALIVKFAAQADGASFRANVDRLRKTLPKWLEKNGLEWTSSK